MIKNLKKLIILVCSLFILAGYRPIFAETSINLNKIYGQSTAAILSDPDGKIIFSINAEKKLVPASILKLLTSLTAFHYLGPGYRFKTEFYIDDDSNLKIKGYGDPVLTSRIVQEISEILKTRLTTGACAVKDIVLDDSYFANRITIPGRTVSLEPYDAPNGALSVNFNTVFFKRGPSGFISAEPETPLLPFALKKIKACGLNHGRIVLSQSKKENTIYAGYLFQYFLARQGFKIKGRIRPGIINSEKDKLIFTYYSKFTIKQAVAKLLQFSNNFIANQTLLAVGADTFGTPGTLAKGCQAMRNYARNQLKINDISIVEGSGISRKNKISVLQMQTILEEFKSYRNLMRHSDNEFFKTGTLQGIKSRAGYLINAKSDIFSFVVITNSQGKDISKIMRKIRLIVEK